MSIIPQEETKTLKNNSATDSRRAVASQNLQAYLDLAHSGKNEWWRYVLSVLLILYTWQILGALPGAALMIRTMRTNGPGAGNGMESFTGSTAGFVVVMLASVFFLCGIYLSVQFIHRRPLWTLISPDRSISWRRFFQGFMVWFALVALMTVAEALLYPGRYVWTLDMGRFLPFVFLALILVPLQTSAEELFFRGYILQGAGLRVRNIWALSAISGLLFGLPHLLNPEASVNYPLLFLYYFAFGFCLAFITLRDGRLELALGAHAANNLFSFVIANYTITVLPTPSLFTISVLDAWYSVPAALFGMAVFIWLFVRLMRRREIPGN